jgi:hypothetical protein
MHFAMCLQRQEVLQDNFLDGVNVLKKQTALPMFHMGERKSIFICKKGMRWFLKQVKKEIAADDEEWEDVDANAALDDIYGRGGCNRRHTQRAGHDLLWQ